MMEVGNKRMGEGAEKAGTGLHVLRVRYAETDQMGVAYHGAYIPWLEEGRTEWFREQGSRYRDLEDRGMFLAVTRVSIRYLEPALYDDLIQIETRLVKRHRASVTLGYRLRRLEEKGGPGPLLAEAETRLAMLDSSKKPTRLPPDFLPFQGSR